MPLPLDHPYYNTEPRVSEKYLPYLVIGSSNHAVGAQTTTAQTQVNTIRSKLFKHAGNIVGFTDPPNAQTVNTYPSLDEQGTQNYMSFLTELIREETNKIPVGIPAGQSATGISNQITGYNSANVLTQTEQLVLTAKSATGAPLKFACVGVSDGDMKFNQDSSTIEALITSYIANLRSRVGQPDLVIFLIAPGLPPTDSSSYPSWATNNTVMSGISISNVYPIITDDMDLATYREVDEIHRNAAGNKLVAEKIHTQYKLVF